MTDKARDIPGRGGKDARAERLKAALRDNLKRRKAQARGRGGMTIVTPDDDATGQDGSLHDVSRPPDETQ